jgi:tetratricopeptide (TPR) repeat protein
MTAAYSVSDLRRILRVSEPELRACLRAALLPIPTRKRHCSYSFQHLVVLRTAKGLSDAGVSVRRIRKVLESLQRQLGESRTMSSVKVYASGQQVVVCDGASRWQPDSGQFLLNFEASPAPAAKRLAPRRPSRPPHKESAAAWFERGVLLQTKEAEAACQAYEQALRLEPSLVEAHINLGLLYHQAGAFENAERCYREALRYQADLPLAHFNLGVVLEDQQRDEAAMEAYERALTLDPRFREAHCNLAELYERHGRQRDALRHYAAARRLG